METTTRTTRVASNKSETVRAVRPACADEAKAVEFLEAMRWGDTACCPRCGDTYVYQMRGRDGERNARYLWRCLGCKRQYTVRVGTVMEDSAIPLKHWCFAFWAASASKKGVSAIQIQRQTGLSYKSALFMMHRIRWAMRDRYPRPLTGDVEVDETYVGGKLRNKSLAERKRLRAQGIEGKPGRKVEDHAKKTEVVAMVSRDGKARAFVPADVRGDNLRDVLRKQIARSARLHTDESSRYRSVSKDFAAHHVVTHGRHEYVRYEGDVVATTNAVESFFSLLKRGVIGTFHNVSRKHLHRYVAEFEFRYNSRKSDDGARLAWLIQNGEGARLTYAEQTA